MPTVICWDHILFVQLWPGSWIYEDKIRYNFTNDYFTIHGIWPEYYNGSWPQYCNRTEKFDVEKLEPIKKYLEKYWTNFKNPESFWKHEFEKHYTCAETDELLDSEIKYFTTGLYLKSELDIYEILKNSSITPSNNRTYSASKIKDTIESTIGREIVITCNKHNILDEIRVCLDRNLELIHCPIKEQNKGCHKKKIWYNRVI